LHGKRNTPTKGRTLPSLQTVDTIMAKIKAKTMTKTMTKTTTEIATKTTMDLEDVATSARKRIADHGNIQIRSGQEQRRPTRASLTTTSRNASSSTLLTAKETTVKT
jgi:hypothetical protein